ncbi:autotransporter [Conexibacter stalactiti]|uniref:Autotransporter n=1 Tax=Conexibacter stalactiti TaxID=1940611 RepID=A0ABU4HI51_9ACTN|nr:autotransporter [Conexibacter stalactiti]MDW5592976.1 autotransporter [Conexibacter stalactiti]MEC5033617.1 autotransporter [Conexibacter stalactiti]
MPRTLLTLVLLAAMSAATLAPAASAKTITVAEKATLRIEQDGTTLTGRGTATGTLPGRVTADVKAVGLGVGGTVKLYPRGGGSLTINVAANIVSRARGTDTLKGNMAVRSGTGTYDDAVGAGPVTATINRRTMIATVTVTDIRLTY